MMLYCIRSTNNITLTGYSQAHTNNVTENVFFSEYLHYFANNINARLNDNFILSIITINVQTVRYSDEILILKQTRKRCNKT